MARPFFGLYEKLKKRGFPLLLGGLLLVALALRLYGLNWDEGHLFHPDERAILMHVWDLGFPQSLGQFLDPQASPLNPCWFPYGSFPLYLLKLVGWVASFFDPNLAGPDLRLVGRVLSALFDLGTILVIALLGARLYGRRVGLLAAALVSFTVLHIQLSHFYAADSLLTLFIVLTLLFAWRFVEKGALLDAGLMGLGLGLALATKISAAPLLLSLLVAALLYSTGGQAQPLLSLSRWRRGLVGLFLALVVAAAIFLVAEPYALLDAKRFLSDTLEQSEMVRRLRDYPYTRQYIDTPAYVYQMSQLSFWGTGLPLGLAAWLGLLFTVVMALRRRFKGDLLLLSWVIPYFLITGSFPVKFLRYLLPLTPFLCLFGARLLLSWWDWAQKRKRPFYRQPWLAGATIILVLLSSALYSLAYLNIYSRPHPAVEVSRWIRENVPPGKHLVKEHWEEGLPDLETYRQSELELYDPDSPPKLNHIVERLHEADYLVFYSHRLYGTIPRLPQRYPLTTAYYHQLFSGKLGFELVYFATSYPSLPGVTLTDDTFTRPGLPTPAPLASYRPAPLVLQAGYADESFTVYDHPKVMLFKKTQALPPEELAGRLVSAERPPPQPGLLLSEEEWQRQREGGTWAQLFHRDDLANRFPYLTWLLLVEALSLTALPLAFWLFRPLPDRGYLLAKGLGILVVVYLAWLGASLHLAPFSRGSIALAWVGLALVSGAILFFRRQEMLASFRENWRVFLLGEALFLSAFALFYAIRLGNPDLWHPYRGGEKPMDFAYLNAVVKSTYLPPYDPWFSGGYLNYYYLGQFLVATLIKFSGVVPSVAYNLAVPLLFALTAGGVFSVVYNLVEASRPRPEASSRNLPLASLGAGLAGVGFVVLLGNLDGLFQVVQGLWAVSPGKVQSTIPGLKGLLEALGGIWPVITSQTPLPPFDYWRSSRMMSPSISITEFPFFTFLFADLHAHLISMPFTVLAIGLALSLALSRRAAEAAPSFSWWPKELPLPRLGRLVALSLVLGSLRWINSWDFPTYFLLAVAAVAIGEYASRPRRDGRFLLWVVLFAGTLYLLSTLFYLPFQQRYELFYGGWQPSREQTPLHQYLSVHGLFLFLLLSFLLWELRALFPRRATLTASPRTALLGASLGLLLLGLILLALVELETVAFLLLMLLLVLWLVTKEIVPQGVARPPHLFFLALVALAIALGIGVDLITVQGDIERMNTVFKFYLQAWVLFGIASAYALWHLLWREKSPFSEEPPSAVGPNPARKERRLTWSRLWLGLLVFLVLACAIYPLAATPVRVTDRFARLLPTNDGMEYMTVAVYHDEKGPLPLFWDYLAILWLQDNLKGSPVILEGNTPLYRWGSRISVYTGLPTVIGWDWHQKQQRWGYPWMVEERLRDVNTLYADPNTTRTLALLPKYQVSYIYVGQLERRYYPASGLAKFEQMVPQYLEPVYQNEGAIIYRVKREAR